jgi:uncharacterized protein (DUF433 family)
MFDRITFDPKIMGGRACIRGMRIPVSVIVRQIAHGAGFEEILEDLVGCVPRTINRCVLGVPYKSLISTATHSQQGCGKL